MTLDDRPAGTGFERHAKALRARLPTSRHAEMLVQAVQAQLGARAFVEVRATGLVRRVFAAESDAPRTLMPWPIVELALGPASSASHPPISLDGMEIESWKVPQQPPPPPRQPVPKLRGLSFADLTISEGSGSFQIRYGEDGGAFESSTSGERVLHALSAARDATAGNALEQLADRIVAFHADQAGPGRLHLPVHLPCGAQGAWGRAIGSVRRALWQRRVPADACFLAVECYAGEQMCFGAGRDEAWAALRAAIEREQPRPPKPAPAPNFEDLEDDLPPGTIILRAPPPDMPWPEPTPENTPVAFVPVPAAPATPCPFGAWIPLVDDWGNVTYAALRHDPDGFTLVDGSLLGEIDLDDIDAAIAGPEAEQEERWRQHRAAEAWRGQPSMDYCVSTFAFRDSEGRIVPPRVTSSGLAPQPNHDGLDGGRLRGCVVRQRWLA